jgi:hypothetical protein
MNKMIIMRAITSQTIFFTPFQPISITSREKNKPANNRQRVKNYRSTWITEVSVNRSWRPCFFGKKATTI